MIEITAERFDKLSPEDQDRTLSYELLHIPYGFKGRFRRHRGYVNDETVDTWYKRYCEKKDDQ